MSIIKYRKGGGEMTVFVDLLIGTNLIINYSILHLSAKAVKLHPRRRRLLLGAIIGSIGSLSIFLPTPNSALLSTIFDLLIKIVLCISITASVYLPCDRRVFTRATFSFLLMSLALVGTTLALVLTINPIGTIATFNGVYFDISPLTLILFTTISYLILMVIDKMSSRIKTDGGTYTISIELPNTSIQCTALLDTGCDLTDVYTGDPVIVVAPDIIQNPIEQLNGYRCIPFKSLGRQSGMLEAFRPDCVTLDVKGRKIKYEQITVAKSTEPFGNGCGALLPNGILTKL